MMNIEVSQRLICPHCRRSIHLAMLESVEMADHSTAPYRICPECDAPIVLAGLSGDAPESVFEHACQRRS